MHYVWLIDKRNGALNKSTIKDFALAIKGGLNEDDYVIVTDEAIAKRAADRYYAIKRINDRITLMDGEQKIKSLEKLFDKLCYLTPEQLDALYPIAANYLTKDQPSA